MVPLLLYAALGLVRRPLLTLFQRISMGMGVVHNVLSKVIVNLGLLGDSLGASDFSIWRVVFALRRRLGSREWDYWEFTWRRRAVPEEVSSR